MCPHYRTWLPLPLLLLPAVLCGQTTIFSDGFESGSTAVWSQAVGGGGGAGPCDPGLFPSNPLEGNLGAAAPGYTEFTCVEIRNDRASARNLETATAGIPMPASLGLTSTSGLALLAGNTRVAAQFRVLARFGGPPDNTALPIRWLGISTAARVSASSASHYRLVRYASPVATNDPFAASITPTGGDFTVDTGVARFVLDPTNPALLDSIAVDLDDDGMGAMTPVYNDSAAAGPRLIVDRAPAADLTLDRSDAGEVAVDAGSFEIVEAGPVRVVVQLRGHFVDPTLVCTSNVPSYDPLGYTAVFTWRRGRRDFDLQFHVRNECTDGYGGSWTDDVIRLHEASWNLPFSGLGTLTSYFAGVGAQGGSVTSSQSGFSGTTLVEQRKGAGNPWSRRAWMRLDSTTQASGATLEQPLVGIVGSSLDVAFSASLGFMRFREPQALAAVGSTLSLRVVSDSQGNAPLVIGEGKGLWNFGQFQITPTTGGPTTSQLEAVRTRASSELERGLLVRAPLNHVNASQLFPSLGTNASSAFKTTYLDVLSTLHDETVLPGGQWDRAKTFGSQLWPDIQFDLYNQDQPNPQSNSGSMNYWNPSGAELYEFLRTGDPKWVWDFALPQSWLQMFSAYLNMGQAAIDEPGRSNRDGHAVTSGGSGEGHWHRSAFGSDDYTYNRGMQLAYALHPNPAMRDRFAAAGSTVIQRYDPALPEDQRDFYLSTIDVVRGKTQHYEMLANCAEFVGGALGASCDSRLHGIVDELVTDNLAAGVPCQGDPFAAPSTCDLPQQFMSYGLHYWFFHRYYRNYGDPGSGDLERMLWRFPELYYEQGMATLGDGVSIDPDGDWAALLQCDLTNGGTEVGPCNRLDTGDGVTILNHNRPQTMSLLMAASEINPAAGPPQGLCNLAKGAMDAGIADYWYDYTGGGWFKGSAQQMQGAAFAVGQYDTCE